MANINPQDQQNAPPIEKDYEEHKLDPGPSKEAVVEEDKNGASKVLKWILPALVVLLLIVWFFVKE
ncbi:MAG TPA: hypothetical protein VNI52_07975 [Sphingobacteriaceae bacterium]|nr:hypothetical protein [Sphingobacteriaceae bacterium]